MYGSAEQVEKQIVSPRMPRAFLDQPLSIGDWEQIKVLRAMNGDRPYCSTCFKVIDGGVDDIGEPCTSGRCTGFCVPGAAMEARWRKFAYIDGC